MAKHLIHIGYPKAASSFLQEWFSQHPQLYFRQWALAGFNDAFNISQYASLRVLDEIRYYITSCEGLVYPRSSTNKYPTEFGLKYYKENVTPDIAQKKVCETLKAIYPTSKILIITRGFKKFIKSAYSQYIRSGGRMILSDFCDKATREQEYLLDYTYLINLYFDAFGKENVIVLPMELLRDDKNKFLGIIEKELGLEHFEDNIGRINESISAEEMYWYPRISSRIADLASKFGRKRYDKIYSWYIHQTIQNKLKTPIKLLTKWKPDKKVLMSDFPEELFIDCDKKAAILKYNPLFQPYLSEYFLE